MTERLQKEESEGYNKSGKRKKNASSQNAAKDKFRRGYKYSREYKCSQRLNTAEDIDMAERKMKRVEDSMIE